MAVTPRSSIRVEPKRGRRTAPRRESNTTPSSALSPYLWLAVPFAILLVAMVGFQVYHAGRVYPGVSALGLDLGGNTPEAAEELLAARTAELASTAVTVRLGDQEWRTTASEVGTRLDERTLADAAYQIGREGSLPSRLVDQISSMLNGTEVAWTAASPDQSALASFVRDIAASVDQPVEDAYLAVKPDFTLDYRSGRVGRSLDQQALVPELRQALLQGGELDLQPFVHEIQPKTNEGQITDARQAAERILASPLAFRFEEREWVIERETLAELLTFQAKEGATWTAKVDDEPIRARLAEIAAEINQQSEDARLSWDGETFTPLRESRDGRELDVEAAAQQALAALESDNHIVDLPVHVTKPAVDMNEAHNMGIVELIDSASTSFAGSIPEKQHNIKLAASRLNGVVVAPGQTFSFNEEVGPTTLETGFEWGYGLESAGENVKTVPSIAGGICQVATTLFQPVFWSGYQLEERNWHLYWIPAYTSRNIVGLDATVDEAAGLDFKFVNNSSTYLLIESWTEEDDTLHFALYGTIPSWTVSVAAPVITNKRPPDPKPVAEEHQDMDWGWRLQVSSAREGFDVAIGRTVTDGEGVRTLNLTSVYQPSRNVTLFGTNGKPDNISLESLLAPSEEPTPEPIATPDPNATPDPKSTPAADSTAASADQGTPAADGTPAPQPAAPVDTQNQPVADQQPVSEEQQTSEGQDEGEAASDGENENSDNRRKAKAAKPTAVPDE